jgi:hypothetical protein
VAVDEIDGGEDPGWVKVMANNPSRKIVSAIDLERWLASLEAGDRMLLALRQAGCTLAEIRTTTGRSMSFTCARLKELGEELAARMDMKMGLRRAS